MIPLITGLAIFLLLILAAWLLWPKAWIANPGKRFQIQRLQLQNQFFQEASQSGKPRGLVWITCEFGDEVVFAREKQTGKRAALVPVLIAFDAIPGSDMEGLEALHNIRTASAVFFYHDDQWHTTGRAIFNLDPEEAIIHLGQYYERITD